MSLRLAPRTVLTGLPAVRSVYQPVVDLSDGRIVGYEALVRGAKGSALQTPAQLFAWAADHGRLADLDWACRISALQGALDAGLGNGCGLFVNVEPVAAVSFAPAGFTALAEAAADVGFQPVIEVTERSLVHDPAALLAFVATVRRRGWAVAVDDVGTDPASLAMLPFLAPDIIKLDLRLVQGAPSGETERVLEVVHAQAQDRGALVLAEGVETAAHEQMARDLGARLAQGFRFGSPAQLARPRAGDAVALPVPPTFVAPAALASWPAAPVEAEPTTLWDMIRAEEPGQASRSRLLAMSQQLERRALAADPGTAMVLSCFHLGRQLGRWASRRYGRLADSACLVVAFGEGVSSAPASGVRVQRLSEQDPLAGEWVVVMVSPRDCGALVARPLPDGGGHHFEYVTSEDRSTVLALAETLLTRVGAEPPRGAAASVARPVVVGAGRA